MLYPSSFASRRNGAPSSYWDDVHHDVKDGQSTQCLTDSWTTFYIIGIGEAMNIHYALKPLPQPITFNTANGQAAASHVAEFPFSGNTHDLRAYVSLVSVSANDTRGVYVVLSSWLATVADSPRREGDRVFPQ